MKISTYYNVVKIKKWTNNCNKFEIYGHFCELIVRNALKTEDNYFAQHQIRTLNPQNAIIFFDSTYCQPQTGFGKNLTLRDAVRVPFRF